MGSWDDKMRLHTERKLGVLLLNVFSLPLNSTTNRAKSVGSCKNAR